MAATVRTMERYRHWCQNCNVCFRIHAKRSTRWSFPILIRVDLRVPELIVGTGDSSGPSSHEWTGILGSRQLLKEKEHRLVTQRNSSRDLKKINRKAEEINLFSRANKEQGEHLKISWTKIMIFYNI